MSVHEYMIKIIQYMKVSVIHYLFPPFFLDRINLYVYKNRLSSISKQKEKLFFPLREFCGMESIDKENKSPKLVIINATQPLSLRFEKKEDRDHWVDTIVTEGNFGEGN